MNDLETRIYHDATRTAAEVTAADIRPFDLPEAGRSGAGQTKHGRPGSSAARWSGGRPGKGRWRVLAPVAAAVSVAGLAAVLVIAGSGPAHHGGRTVPPRPLAKPTSSADRALGTEALDSYFPASGATYTAGLAFNWAQAKITATDIDPCLAAAGFPQPAFKGSVGLYKLLFWRPQPVPRSCPASGPPWPVLLHLAVPGAAPLHPGPPASHEPGPGPLHR